MDAVTLKGLKIGGLYLAPPHGELIWEGRKKSIVCPSEKTLRGQYILISGKKAYGVVSIGTMKVVPANQFNDLFPEHRITTKERDRWWPDAEILFSHEITGFDRCDKLVPVVVPSGVGMLMGRVEFGTRRIGGGTMPYDSLAKANPAIRGIKPLVTLAQANLIASWADKITGVDSPWAVAIANFKKAYRVEGGKWVKKTAVEKAIEATDEGDVVILRGTKAEELVETETAEEVSVEVPSEPEAAPVAETTDEEELEKVVVAEEAEVEEVEKNLKAAWPVAKEAIAELAKALVTAVKAHVGNPEPISTNPITLVKGVSGETLLITRTTNAFKDRDGEIFTTQSLHDYVERHRNDKIKGALRYRHLRGSDFGDIIFQGVQGRFLLEVHRFHDTPVGQAMEAVFKQYAGGHPSISPEGWGVSHGFFFTDHDVEDGVYKRFDKFETSVLPAHVAANPYTNMEVVTMDGKEKQEFSALVGPENAEQQIAGADQETKRLEVAGVEHKELAKPLDQEELVKAIVAQVGEAYKLGELSTGWTAMAEQMNEIGKRLAIVEKGEDARVKESIEEVPNFGWDTAFRASQADETVTDKVATRVGATPLIETAKSIASTMLPGRGA